MMMQQSDRTVYVGNVGKEVDEAALAALFGHCGTVTQIRIAGEPSYETRYAFIEFAAVEESQTALLLDGMNVFDRVIKVNMARGGSGPGIVRSSDPDRVQRTVHVGGLPMEELNEEALAKYFSHVGEVNAVRKSGRFAWVEFATLQAAQQAMSLDGEALGTGIMKVSTSKTPIHTAGWRAPKFRDQAAPGAAAAPPPFRPMPGPPLSPQAGLLPRPPFMAPPPQIPADMGGGMHAAPPPGAYPPPHGQHLMGAPPPGPGPQYAGPSGPAAGPPPYPAAPPFARPPHGSPSMYGHQPPPGRPPPSGYGPPPQGPYGGFGPSPGAPPQGSYQGQPPPMHGYPNGGSQQGYY